MIKNKLVRMSATIGAAGLFMAVASPAMATTTTAEATHAEQTEAAKTEIWTMEQAIYAGRAKADFSAYANNVAEGYVAWPPTQDAPVRSNIFKSGRPISSQEQLTMKLMDFSLHGNTAIIYYQTHRTRLADGSAANDRFHVTHTWVRQNGQWRVLGGMARLNTNQ